MKYVITLMMAFLVLTVACTAQEKDAIEETGPKHLTVETFKEKVFNYEDNQQWKFEGEKPCIIDFYADWCAPCKKLAPILEEVSEEYGEKLNIYKVDIDEEKELAQTFGVKSVPTILFVPMDEKPQMAKGLLPKKSIEKAISDVLKIEK